MSRKIEEYLKSQKSQLDVETPDDHLIWEGIRQGLNKQSKGDVRWKKGLRYGNIAALILVLLSIGFVTYDRVLSRRQVELANYDKELGIKENEYKDMVRVKLASIHIQEQDVNPHIDEIFLEIQRLDTVYQQCLEDLKEIGYDERIINTIFDTYELKLYLLELIVIENNKSINYEIEDNVTL